MARFALNFPTQLKQAAEAWASQQRVSLNQFILWAVAEKVGALKQQLDDPAFPRITYRLRASGIEYLGASPAFLATRSTPCYGHFSKPTPLPTLSVTASWATAWRKYSPRASGVCYRTSEGAP